MMMNGVIPNRKAIASSLTLLISWEIRNERNAWTFPNKHTLRFVLEQSF
jgi:hypothetical protein